MIDAIDWGRSVRLGLSAALAAASFSAFAQPIVLNEIHYNPAGDADALEFIELHNPGAVAIDLAGWRFSEGITHTFAPGTVVPAGGFLVIARDPAALTVATGFDGAIAWESGDLSNAGERITLRDALDDEVDTVQYGTVRPWPTAANGSGPSLELINPGIPNNYAQPWRASVTVNGTPGSQNTVWTAQPPPIFVNVVHAPAVPAGNEAVTVTATVINNGAAPSVTVHFRPDQIPTADYGSLPMLDDGMSGDGGAGDRTFGATLPGLPSGSRYDFFITASDGVTSTTYPALHAVPDALGNPSQTLLCQFASETPPADHPVYHLIVTQANRAAQAALPAGAAQRTAFDATFVGSDGTVFYNVTQRHLWRETALHEPPSYRIDFTEDAPFPSPMGFPVRTLLLDSQSPVRQALGYGAFEAAGNSAPRFGFVRLRYNEVNLDSQHVQQDNGYNGVYIAIEAIDAAFLDSQDGAVEPPRPLSSAGNLYCSHGNASLEWRGPLADSYRVDAEGTNGYSKETHAEADDWSDLIGLCDVLNNTSDPAFPQVVSERVDEDEWSRWFALHTVLGNRGDGLYRDGGGSAYLFFPPSEAAAVLIPRDLRMILRDGNETIWRTATDAPQRFLRHNAFAPAFVEAIRTLLDGPLSQAAFDARVDALPASLFPASGGSDLLPQTRQQYKNWFAARRAFIDNEIVSQLTLDLGIGTTDPYVSATPWITIGGMLDQAGTHLVTVNDVPVSFDVFSATWTRPYRLAAGDNDIVVRALDREGRVLAQQTQYVYYESTPASLRLTCPTRMVNSKSVSLRADLLDFDGEIHWRTWRATGAVTARRVSDQSPVETSIVVYDPGNGIPPPDSIAFTNGVGSVTLILDHGAAEPPGDIEITVTLGPVSASAIVTVVDESQPGLFRVMDGTLVGPDLTWGPDDGVIRLTGSAYVPAGQVLRILPGTLIMCDSNGDFLGSDINCDGRVEAVGTRENPIFFFPTNGVPALTMAWTQDWNPDSWRGIQHFATGQTSVYEFCIITGAGNFYREEHPRPSILSFRAHHNFRMHDCIFVDNPGKCVYGTDNGNFEIRRSLFSRVGHGGEYIAGLYRLLIEDSWFTGVGRAPPPILDADCLNIRGSTEPDVFIRRCVFADGGDDAIDTEVSSPDLRDCIIHTMFDKGMSIDDGSTPTFHNVLMFNCSIGIFLHDVYGDMVHIFNFTFGDNVLAPFIMGIGGSASQSIIWPGAADTCHTFDFDHCILGPNSNPSCGVGNVIINPMFRDAAASNYDLLPGSPARTAGPNGKRIGWLGFPRSAYPTGTARLHVEPNPGSPCFVPGQDVTVRPVVEALSDPIHAVRARLHYDAARLALADIVPASGWTITESTLSDGEITLAVGRAEGSEAGPAAVAALTFTTLAPGAAQVGWRPDEPGAVSQLTRASDGRAASGGELDRIDAEPIEIAAEPREGLRIDIELDRVGPGTLTRCLTFEFYECPGETAVYTVEQAVSFTDGVALDVIVPTPCSLVATCLSVRDRLHTLRRTIGPLPTDGAWYVADLTGSQALVGGNLNDDLAIDALDLALLAAAAGANYGGGDTACSLAGPHADLDGDGVAFAADFSFVAANYLRTADGPCCSGGLHEGDGPVGRIAVSDLERLGLGALRAADGDGDGWLTAGELLAYGRKTAEKR